ncbi:MAG: histidine kinase [Oscillospiraceae bacterium]|nr:histidine kinase [Oscillospiraceae bacterium]
MMMMKSIDLANFAIVVSGFVISALGLLLAVFLRQTDRKSRGFFLIFFLLLVGYTASATICQLSGTALLSQITLFTNSLFSSLLIPAITLYLLHCAGRSWKRSPLFALVVALWTVYFVLLAATQFTTWIYYYTPDNVYHRGPWYPLLLIPPVLLMAANMISLYRCRAALTQRQRIAFFIYFVVPLVCMLVQMFFFGLLLIVFGTSLAVLFMFVFLLEDQVERSFRQQQEIANQRASVMVLQMRPHFIHNTMMCIYSLCKQDPQKARQVTMDFSTYLRKNFTAIASATPIPFSSELEHTRAYLAVVQAQYEDSLFVDYDTPHTWFRLPPLTLQPIVENAVKHGRDPYAGPFHISIRTRKTDSGTEITVSDNGRGVHPADDSGAHIALENIRQRLELMCGGRLMITPNETGGTVVTVTIPDRSTE